MEAILLRLQNIGQQIIEHSKALSQIIDFFLAAILLTILLTMTKKGWKGIGNMVLVIIGTTLSGYLFSDAIQSFFPSVYSLGSRFGNTISSVGVFLFLTWFIEKDTYKEIFSKIVSSKLNK